MESKVSILIPCYNVEKYISECIESVLKQTYKNIEIICLDDGSTDNTLQVLRKISETNNNVIVHTQTNCGLGNARKTLFNLSTGALIINLDSDDYFSDSKSVEYMVKKHQKQNDVTSFNFKPYYDGTHAGWIKYSVLNSIRMFIPWKRKIMSHNWYMWAKVFSRSYLETCKFNSLNKCEDKQFFIDNPTNKFKIVNKVVVRYRVRKSSIMRGK